MFAWVISPLNDINVSSGAFVPLAITSVYCAIKAALIALKKDIYEIPGGMAEDLRKSLRESFEYFFELIMNKEG